MCRGSPAAVHGDRRHGRTLRPPLWPGRVRLLPLSHPVALGHRIANQSPLTMLTGESSPSAMAPGRLEHCFSQPPPCSLSSKIILAVHHEIKGPGWPIPFRRGKFVKEPLPFPEIEPAILSVFPHVRFLVLKA